MGLSLPVEPLGRHQGVGSRFRSLYLHQIMELRLERSSGQENGVGFTKVFYTLSGIKTGQPCFPLLPSDPGSKRKGKSPAVHTQDGSAQYKHTTSGVLALTFTTPPASGPQQRRAPLTWIEKVNTVANPLHVEARISFTAAVITADCSQPDKADK